MDRLWLSDPVGSGSKKQKSQGRAFDLWADPHRGQHRARVVTSSVVGRGRRTRC